MNDCIHFVNKIFPPINRFSIPLRLVGILRRAARESDYLMSVRFQRVYEGSSKKTRAASDQYFHHFLPMTKSCHLQSTVLRIQKISSIIVPVMEAACSSQYWC